MVIDAEGMNKRLIDNLSSQLDSLFSSSTEDDLTAHNSLSKSPIRPQRTSVIDDGNNQSSDDELLTNNVEDVGAHKLEEKEKILTTIKSNMQEMQSQWVDMMKQQYERKIHETEMDMRKIDTEKQATLGKTTDSKQQQYIEQQYR